VYKSGELRGNRILFLHPFFTPSSPPLFFSFDHHVLLCVDRTHFRPVLRWNRCSQCTRCASIFSKLHDIITHTQKNQAIAAREDFVPQACSGPNLTGTCTPLNVASSNPTGPAINPAACTNVSNPKSLKLNVDNDCVSFP
jgi:hypothetical protein